MDDSYKRLVQELKRLEALQNILGLLEWDEQVNLPSRAGEQRAAELSLLSGLVHREWQQSDLPICFEKMDNHFNELSNDQKRVIKEARKLYDQATKLPESFVSKKAEARSLSYHAWAKAREENSFGTFYPHLKEQLELAREEADLMGWGDRAYDYWLDQFDPGMTTQDVSQLFIPLEKALPSLASELAEACQKQKKWAWETFPVEGQELFLRELISKVGFDCDHGRLDTSIHPFCAGNGVDTRLTTRYREREPLDSLYSGLHEAGHGMYEQGLPKEHLGTALGKAVGMAIHESQSRIWENQIGRSIGFWKFWEPRYRAVFSKPLNGVSLDELYRRVNQVQFNPIRVDSDEVTYNLHILLRFNLERKLFGEEIVEKDLPEAWREYSQQLLGFRPQSDREGILQDVHWSGGAFGYFPSYCLGNMIAAQLWDAYCGENSRWEEDFEKGDFQKVLEWLRKNVHEHGMKYSTLELTRMVTGKPLESSSLLKYLKARYGALWL